MSVKDDLEIFLITFNRFEKLKNTLDKILSGPISGYDIKILDNASDDKTQQYCEDFVKSHKNFTYIRNKINLGISGNIIRAMELASKKWLWIICDDDDFDWDNWGEIENALTKDYDIVHTTYTEGFRSEEYAYLINEEAFIPTCIYNTKHITPLTMQNAYAMAYTLLPHHAIGCKVINENGKIFVPQKRCVLQGTSDKLNFVRMPRKGMFHKLDDFQLLSGYVGAYKLIEDENIRNQCNNVLCLGNNFMGSMEWFLSNNPRGNIYNIFEILLSVSNENKKELLKVLEKYNNEAFNNVVKIIKQNYNGENRMSIKDKLQIILVTYNRSEHVKNIFKQFFAENSPVKDFDFLVLDNNSSDDTGKVVQDFIKKHPNVSYSKNRYNLGISGNIAKAMEVASKQYVWIIGDDDVYDFSNWGEVEQAVNNDEQVICVARYCLPDNCKNDPVCQMAQITFISGVIFNTNLYNDLTMRDTFDNIFTLFPHLVPVMHLLNNGGHIYVADKPISSNGWDPNKTDASYTRGLRNPGDLSPRSRSMNWVLGYSTVCGILKDNNIENRMFMHGCIGISGGSEDGYVRLLKRYFINKQLCPMVLEAYSVSSPSLRKKLRKLLCMPSSYIWSRRYWELFLQKLWKPRKRKYFQDKIDALKAFFE